MFGKLVILALLLQASSARGDQESDIDAKAGAAAHRPDAVGVDQYAELSYLVFEGGKGFDRPTVETDLLAGTLTLRFKKLPEAWRQILEAQVATERKRRFFQGFEPVLVDGRPVGVTVSIGVAGFDVTAYLKNKPRRWVLRLAEHRVIPAGSGMLAVPVVPYADLLDPELDTREAFAAAERAIARGAPAGCEAMARFAASQDAEIAGFAALRAVDCPALASDPESVRTALDHVASGTGASAALARIRLIESNGQLLGPEADWSHFDTVTSDPAYAGAVADEASLRRIRAHFWRGEFKTALARLETFQAARAESPFAAIPGLEHGLRRRVVLDAVRAEQWLDASRAYLAAPADAGVLTAQRAAFDLMGAQALREIGMPKQASRVYLKLLKSPPPELTERDLLLALAEAYTEDHDAARADFTLRYVEEKWTDVASRRATRKLRGLLALGRGNVRAAAEAAEALEPTLAGRGARRVMDTAGGTGSHIDPSVGVFAARTAISALETEGLPAARQLIAPHAAFYGAQGLANEVARDLAAAAGDCDALVARVKPLELAAGDDLLLGGVCLLGQGRVQEALVLVDAANVWAAADLAAPELDTLLDTVRRQALWWLQNERPVETAKLAI